MKLRRTISLLLAVVLLATMAVVSVSAADSGKSSTGAYNNQNLYEGSSYTYNGEDLGATYSPSSTTWKVWSPAAKWIKLKLYSTGSDREMGAKVIGTYDLTKGLQYVWSVTLEGDYKNVYYTYLINAEDMFGNVVTNETQDVYSKAVGVNGNRSMVVDLDSTDPDGWSDDKHVCHSNKTEASVWEIHIRDFSCDPDSGVSEKNQGNYLAFTEGGTTYKKEGSFATCLDYLVENNINTVQLMPFADFDGVDEVYGASEVDRNWGYNPKNFNVPDGSYSSNSYDGNVRINEVKQMIQALHDRNIQVVMDVVYNHTAGSEGSSFTKTVPRYYYRMSSQLANYDGSGQGNEMASDKSMMRNFIVQSLKYWANEYHIDGFRFDLMGCIDITTLNTARSALNQINQGILMYGEPWSGGTSANPEKPLEETSAFSGTRISSGVGGFSGNFRTAASKVDSDKALAQGWVGGTTGSESTIVSGIKANLMNSSDNTKTVNFLDCHDNLTLWDRLVGAYTKSGEGKSSVTTGTQYVNSTNQSYLRKLKLGGVLTFTSQGITFLNAGTEFARTKQGQGNSYNSADTYNKLDWSRVDTYKSSVAYFRGLRQIHEVFSAFSDDSGAVENSMTFIKQSNGVIAYTITNSKSGEWNKVMVIMNASGSAQDISLSGSWVVVADADNAGITSLRNASGSYSAPAGSAAILVDSSSFGNVSQNKFQYATLTTKHVLNGSVVKTETAKYRVGTKYHALKDKELLLNNNITSTEGSASGTVTGNTTVTFNYEPNGETNAKLTVKYLDEQDKALTPDMVYTLENGDDYSIPVCSIQRYQLDTDKYPANTTGTFSGVDETIIFKYKPLATQTTTVRYYKSGNTLSGGLLIYAYTDDGLEPLGAWANNPRMNKEGSTGWYNYEIPIASCYVMFHGSTGGQEPGQNEPGYLVSGECSIKDRVISYKSTVVTSHIDIDTGRKLKPDVVETDEKTSTEQYTTSADPSLGTLVETPANAEGFYKAGVTNVVYLYRGGQLPTETTEAPPVVLDRYVLGDSNCDGQVNINDVTYIQQYLVTLVVFDNTSKRNADVDGSGKVTILDANYIQRWMVGMTLPYDIGQLIEITDKPTQQTQATQATQATQPTQGAPETMEIYFSNGKFWTGDIYCHYWDDGGDLDEGWPGEPMTFVENNSYGQGVYKIEVPVGCNVIFSGTGGQTVDIYFDGGDNGFYPLDTTDGEGHYNYGSYVV
ncbi:MAG: type I pullulanase [Ruminococcus sp.]|nr:type I pullulanase [Ruminococcus sp.]